MKKIFLALFCFLCIYVNCFTNQDIISIINSNDNFDVVSKDSFNIKSFDAPTTGPPLCEPDMVWVNDTLASMTLDEKIGQMLISSQHSSGETLINYYKVGGFIFTGNGQLAENIVSSVNRLQNYSKMPLWFAIDAEAGLGARVANATIFPLIMASGAANDPELTELCGRITARECRSIGIQTAYGPVVDVNTEPINPIISTRSYGDDPMLVARLARGFIKGARAEGLLCTFKHYPGHGATTGDSHSSLPTVDLPLSVLEDMHIKPYRLLAASGDVDLVMTAHVWYSQVDTLKPWPATLSSIFLKDILRTSIKYDGIIISDSYDMTGLTTAVPDAAERAVIGVENGLDIILNPTDVGAAFNGIKNAVNSDRITIDRINQSVKRILIAKSRVGLPENKFADTELYKSVLQHPEHIAVVKRLCEKAFTKYKYTLSNEPPITTTSNPYVLPLNYTYSIFYTKPYTFFTDAIKIKVPGSLIENQIPKSVSQTLINQIVAEAPKHDVVIILSYDWYKIGSTSQINLINELCKLSVPIIYISFGAPYHLLQIPKVDAFYCGYASVQQMQETAVDALLGNVLPRGEIPVDFDDLTKHANDWYFH